jgi:hypothetical protein
MSSGIKLYATIRKESKYYHQQNFKEKKPVPFPVSLEIEVDPEWPVKGGVGGNYTLHDVELWWMSNEGLLLIPMHSKPRR